MKKLFYFVLLLISTFGFAQNKGITYQAVIYTPGGQNVPGVNVANLPLANRTICLQFSLLDASSGIEYQEVVKTKTDEFGMVNITIGSGTQTGGYASSFASILWNAAAEKSLKVALDATGLCSQFDELSVEKLDAVPFANAAITAGNVSGVVALANGGTGATTAAGARTNLGLGNVDNTSDLNKPMSTATKIYVDSQLTSSTIVDADTTTKGKVQLAGDLAGTAAAPTVPGLALKENVANKSTVVTLGTSNVLFPTQNAVKTYVDTAISGATIADADATTKGKIKLGGDLAGTADAPAIASNAISTAKVADNAITDVKIAAVSGSKITGNIAGNATNVTGVVGVTNGGTGATTVAAARTNLGLGSAALNNTSDFEVPLTFTSPLVRTVNSIAVPPADATVNGYLKATDFYTFANKINSSEKAANNGVATLGNDGKIPSSQIPAISFQSVNVVNSQAAMIANSAAQVGSITIRTDINRNFVLSNLPASTLSNWIELSTPTSVTSVNGYAGPNVSLTKADIVLGNVDNTSDINKPISIDTRAALDLKANLASPTFTGNVSGITKSMVGLGNVDNTTDAGKPISTATQAALDLKANTADVTTSLALKANVTDVSSALALKANTTVVTTSLALKEDTANKSIDVTADGASDVKYPSAKAVKTYADAKIVDTIADAVTTTSPSQNAVYDALQLKENSANKSTAIDLGSTNPSDVLFPSQKAVKTYVDLQSANAGVADASLTSAKILDGTLVSADFADGSVTTAKLAANAVTTAKITDANVTEAKLADDAVTTIKIKNANVTNAKLDKANIPLSGFGAAAADVALGSNKLTGVADPTAAQDAATKSYVDTAIAGATIADADATTKGKIQLSGDLTGSAASPAVATGAISTAKLADDAVTTVKITDANVTTAKLAANAVTTAKITDSNVTAAKLASDAVETAKIKDANVTEAKLADVSVSTAKLATNAVTTAKITDANVTEAKLADGSVTTAKLAANAVTTAKITDANVTEAKLADDAVTTIKIKNANVTNAKLDKANIPLSGFGAAAADVALGANKLTGVADPTAAQDAATKNYVDTAISSSSTTAVPYTGATGAVNLGAYDLTVNGITVGKGSGAKSDNTVFGVNALSTNSTGNYNTAIGTSALKVATAGYNTAIGNSALYQLTSGTYNTAIGYATLATNTDKVYNTAVGSQSMRKNAGNFNTALGESSLYGYANSPFATGDYNTAIGYQTLQNVTTAANNVALGAKALNNLTGGNENTVIGYNSGLVYGSGAGTNLTGLTQGVLVGSGARTAANNTTNEIVIGYNALGNGSNTVTIGNSSTTANYFTGSLNSTGQLISTVADGTAPFVVTSTTPVANLNIAGNAANVTGTVAIANGGTGATTAAAALTNLGAEPTANKSTATNLGATSPSDDLFPTQKAVKTYVDAQTAAAGVSDGSITSAKILDGTIAAVDIADNTITGAKLNSNLYAAGKTFTFQDLLVGAGTTFGRIATDGTKHIAFEPTYNVESTRFWGNGNITIQTGGTFTDNGYKLEVAGTTKFGGNATIAGTVTASSGITGTQFTSTIADGTAPFVVTSTTPVANLSIGGNAATVTTNANLTGDVTSSGNTTTIGANKVVTGMIANANVTNAKLDKANIPLSGFGAAAADVALGANKLTGVADPTLAQDAATKNYVDTATAGITTLADGKIYLGNASNVATEVTPSGDVTMTNAGVTAIGTGKVVVGMLATDAVETIKIKDANVTEAKLADDAVTTIKIKNANVTNAKLDKANIPLSGFGAAAADVALGANKLTGVAEPTLAQDAATKNYVDTATSAITTLADGKIYLGNASNVATEVTPTGDVTMTNAGVTAIGTGKVVVGMLATDAVETIKIKDANVTAAKLATDAVETAKIKDAAVETAKVKDANITYAKIQNVSATNKVLGRVSANAGVVEEIATTGSGDVVRATSPTLVTPNLGTPSAVDLTNALALPLTSGVTGILPVANGGTGSATQNFVDLTTDQTIAGVKTLSSDIVVNGVNIGLGKGAVATNTAVGTDAISATATGAENTAMGYNTLKVVTSGSKNTSIGSQAAKALTTGTDNTTIGYRALSTVTSSQSNTAIGNDALRLLGDTTNDRNTAVGTGSFANLTTGQYNVGVGMGSLLNAGSGSNNVAVGKYAGFRATNDSGVSTSNKSIFIGSETKSLNPTSDNEIVIGYDARGLGNNSTVIGNTSITQAKVFGALNLPDITTSTSTTTGALTVGGGVGIVENLNVGGNVKITGTIEIDGGTPGAGKVLTSDANGVASWTSLSGVTSIGTISASSTANGASITSGVLNLAPADATNGGVVNTTNQTFAGSKTFNSDISVNTVKIGKGNGTGSGNTALGSAALNANTTGSYNTMVGGNSGVSNTTGQGNVSVGYSSLNSNTTGSNNISIGNAAMNGMNTYNYNVGIGQQALRYVKGNYNVAIGDGAGANLGSAATTGTDNNIMIGGNAGYQAGVNGSNTAGKYSIFIGYDTRPAADAETNEIVISGYNGSAGTVGLGSNTTLIGNSATTQAKIFGALTLPSTTASTSTTTGALIVGGGAGIGGALFVGSNNGSYSTTTGALQVAGGAAITENLYIGGTLNGLNVKSAGTGSFNTAFGKTALNANTTGTTNTAFGHEALKTNTTGGGNTAIGYSTLSNFAATSSNTAIGDRALVGGSGATGNTNIAVGGSAINSITTGSSNVAVGYTAGSQITTGGNNVFLGHGAGNEYGSGNGNFNVTGSNSTFVGYQTRPAANGETNELVIAGYNGSSPTVGLGSHTSLIGNSSTTMTALMGDVLVGSTTDGGDFKLQVTGNTKLTGTLTVTGGTPGAGKVLTSDANGLASWSNGLGSAVTTTTAAYAITLAESIVFYTGTAAGTFSIPAAASTNNGKQIIIKNKTGFGITVTPASGTIYIDNANAAAASVSLGIEASNNWIKLVSDGTQWNVLRALF